MERYYPQVDFNLMFKTAKSIGDMFNFKDRIQPLMRSKVVYKIRCGDCNDFYIGKTSRNLITRLNEHKMGKNSSVSEHGQSLAHKIDWESIEIIDNASSDRLLLLKEMLHINNLKPEMNKQLNSELFCLLIGQNKI